MTEHSSSPANSLMWQEIRAQARLRKLNADSKPGKRGKKNFRATLGIGGGIGHDSNVALLIDGKLIAAMQEERHTRIKHDGCFPFHSIAECLQMAGISAADVDACVFSEKMTQKYLFHRTGRVSNAVSYLAGRVLPAAWFNTYPQAAGKMFTNASFYYTWHHLAHASSAYYSSGFDEATFLCVDGIGEDLSASIGTVSAKGGKIIYDQPYDNGLGMLYSLVTYFLGFHAIGSEYKVMGLAPYGTPLFSDALNSMLARGHNGGSRVMYDLNFGPGEMKKGSAYLAAALGMPPRQPGDPLLPAHLDIASSLQAVFEEEIMKMVRFAHEHVGGANLLFCGGCAQNCVAAGKLRDTSPFHNVFNSPVGTDMSNGLGAALIYEQRFNKKKIPVDLRGYYLGGEPGEAPAQARPYEVPFAGTIHEETARLLANGKIVAWVRGRMELGARALGARSILADARQRDMQSVLNMKVKFRESFRPFAPAVLAEQASNWFDLPIPSDYMQYTAPLKQVHRLSEPLSFTSLHDRLNFQRCVIPSVVHVDHSARVQTVDKNIHPDFHGLISAFYNITDVPMIINTSFNVNGQPIIRTAAEAWECFVNTDIDYLVINDALFRNPFNRTLSEKKTWLKSFEGYLH
jgi:carbamoyltransferase